MKILVSWSRRVVKRRLMFKWEEQFSPWNPLVSIRIVHLAGRWKSEGAKASFSLSFNWENCVIKFYVWPTFRATLASLLCMKVSIHYLTWLLGDKLTCDPCLDFCQYTLWLFASFCKEFTPVLTFIWYLRSQAHIVPDHNNLEFFIAWKGFAKLVFWWMYPTRVMNGLL